MDQLAPEQEEAIAATVEAIQRIAMAIVALPKEERAAHYALVRRNFEAAITKFGIEGAMAHAWLKSTMIGIESLVTEIEAGGGGRRDGLGKLPVWGEKVRIQNVRSRVWSTSSRNERKYT